MIYFAIAFSIVCLFVTIIACVRSSYWKYVATWQNKRAEIFYRQYVDLVKNLDNESWKESE